MILRFSVNGKEIIPKQLGFLDMLGFPRITPSAHPGCFYVSGMGARSIWFKL